MSEVSHEIVSFEQRLRKVPFSGILFALISSITAAFPNFTVKLLPEIHAVEIVVIRNIDQLLFCAIFLALSLSPVSGKSERWPLIASGFFGFVAFSAGYMCFRYIPFGDGTAIMFSAPVYVSIFSVVLLTEPFALGQFILLCLTMSGVLLISKPTFIFGTETGDVIYGYEGHALAFVGSISLALSYVFTRMLKKTSSMAILAWYSAVSVICGFLCITISQISAGQTFKSPTDFTIDEWLLLMVNSTCGAISQLCLTMALKLEEAGVVSLTRCTDIILAYLLQVLFLAEPIHWSSMLGSVIVTMGVAATCIRKIREQRQQRQSQNTRPATVDSKV